MNWITTTQQVEDLADTLLGYPEIAIDTESNGFHGYFRGICLVQIATDDEVFLLDVQELPYEAWELLQDVLLDPSISIVMHGASNDISGLQRDLGLHVSSLFDTQLAACFLNLPFRGLDKLLHQYYGLQSSKKYQRFDWSIRPLPEGALKYAAQDVRHLLPLKEELWRQLEQSPYLEAVLQESAAMAAKEAEPYSFNPEGYRKLKGVKELNRRHLAVLKELFKWRHDVCSHLDRAEFMVCSDNALLQLTLRQPHEIRQMKKIRALGADQLRKYGDEILKAIQRGRHAPLPPFKLPKPKRKGPRKPDKNNDVYDALREWRKEKSDNIRLEAGLLVSNKTLEGISRWLPKTHKELEEMEGWLPWRTEKFGDDILKVIKHTA